MKRRAGKTGSCLASATRHHELCEELHVERRIPTILTVGLSLALGGLAASQDLHGIETATPGATAKEEGRDPAEGDAARRTQ